MTHVEEKEEEGRWMMHISYACEGGGGGMLDSAVGDAYGGGEGGGDGGGSMDG